MMIIRVILVIVVMINKYHISSDKNTHIYVYICIIFLSMYCRGQRSDFQIHITYIAPTGESEIRLWSSHQPLIKSGFVSIINPLKTINLHYGKLGNSCNIGIVSFDTCNACDDLMYMCKPVFTLAHKINI